MSLILYKKNYSKNTLSCSYPSFSDFGTVSDEGLDDVRSRRKDFIITRMMIVAKYSRKDPV